MTYNRIHKKILKFVINLFNEYHGFSMDRLNYLKWLPVNYLLTFAIPINVFMFWHEEITDEIDGMYLA